MPSGFMCRTTVCTQTGTFMCKAVTACSFRFDNFCVGKFLIARQTACGEQPTGELLKNELGGRREFLQNFSFAPENGIFTEIQRSTNYLLSPTKHGRVRPARKQKGWREPRMTYRPSLKRKLGPPVMGDRFCPRR